MTSARRDGFSLLEVLMATSILLGSIIVLNQLAGIGRKNAMAAQDLATAQLLCQTQLNEFLIGTTAADSTDEQPIAGAPGWVYSVDVEPLESTEQLNDCKLAVLTLTVSRESEQDNATRYTLVRWIPDPDSASSSVNRTNDSAPVAEMRPVGAR